MKGRKKYGQIYLLSDDETPMETANQYDTVVFEAPNEGSSFVVALLECGLKISLNDTGIKSNNILLHIDTEDNTLTIIAPPQET